LLGPLFSSAVVTAILLFAPVRDAVHAFDADGLDAAALELGLRARVGDELDDWTVRIEAGEGGRYQLMLRGPGDARAERRTVELNGRTDEDRSRELASTLALIIEAVMHEPSDPGQSDASASTPARGFVVVEGHVGLGPPRALDPELGVGLGAGAWLLGEHLQPRVRVRWAHGWAGELDVHQLGAGLGLAAGAPVGRLWLGALAMPAFKWTRAQQVRASSAWAGGGELSALAQLRFEHVLLGVRTGVETTFPALRASGTQDVIRWGHLRWLLVFEIGIGIPKTSEFQR
jgi:hypothetical protein